MAKAWGTLVERPDGAGYEWEYEPINEGPQIIRDKNCTQFVDIIDSFLRVDREGNYSLAKAHMLSHPDELLSWLENVETEAPEIAALLRAELRKQVDQAGGIESIRAECEAHAVSRA